MERKIRPAAEPSVSKDTARSGERRAASGGSTAFLLSQVGGQSALRFAELLAPLGLAPPDAGILYSMGISEGLSQRALGKRLGILPSRLVALIDALESKGLVERR